MEKDSVAVLIAIFSLAGVILGGTLTLIKDWVMQRSTRKADAIKNHRTKLEDLHGLILAFSRQWYVECNEASRRYHATSGNVLQQATSFPTLGDAPIETFNKLVSLQQIYAPELKGEIEKLTHLGAEVTKLVHKIAMSNRTIENNLGPLTELASVCNALSFKLAEKIRQMM